MRGARSGYGFEDRSGRVGRDDRHDKGSAKDEVGDIARVEVDALIILQIMKHCRQHVPHHVTGQLLGLDIDDSLQVTHYFGYVQSGTTEEGHNQADDGEQYQIEVLRRLREVNVDSNTVGWYQTTHLGQFFSDTVIETQFLYQSQIPRSALLVYDPLQSAIGKPAFKAFRLTPEFMQKQQEVREAQGNPGASANANAALADFPSNMMFKEVPIEITSPLLVEAFLVEWALSDPYSTTTQLEALDLDNQAFLEKNVQLLIGSLQDLAEEQQKLQMYERNLGRDNAKGKGRDRFRPQGPPRQLDTMILSQQIQNYCKQINAFAGDAFGKLYLVSNKPSSGASK